MNIMPGSQFERVERSVLQVYNYCPPTFVSYSPEGRALAKRNDIDEPSAERENALGTAQDRMADD